VPARGTKGIKVASETQVTLVANTPDGTVVRIANIAVPGARGEESDFEERLNAFRYPYACGIGSAQDPGAMGEWVVKSIQTNLQAVHRTLIGDGGSLLVESSRLRLSQLQTNLPPAYFGRRISYLVAVPKLGVGERLTPGSVTIKSFIEFRRRAEPTWYPETDETLYRTGTSRFEEALERTA